MLLTHMLVLITTFVCSIHVSGLSNDSNFLIEEDLPFEFDVERNVHKTVKRQAEENVIQVEKRCEDLHKNCRRWAKREYCNHPDYTRFMVLKCQRSCNLCDDGDGVASSNVSKSCHDQRDECEYWADTGHCRDEMYQKFMTLNCKRSCRLCPDQQPSTSASTTSTSAVVVTVSTFTVSNVTIPFETTAEAQTSSKLTTTVTASSYTTDVQDQTTDMYFISTANVTDEVRQTTEIQTPTQSIVTFATSAENLVSSTDATIESYVSTVESLVDSKLANDSISTPEIDTLTTKVIQKTTAATAIPQKETATPNVHHANDVTTDETFTTEQTDVTIHTSESAVGAATTRPESQTQGAPQCEDRLTTCRYFSENSCKTSTLMKLFCPKTCGLCGDVAMKTEIPSRTNTATDINPTTNHVDMTTVYTASDVSFVSTLALDLIGTGQTSISSDISTAPFKTIPKSSTSATVSSNETTFIPEMTTVTTTIISETSLPWQDKTPMEESTFKHSTIPATFESITSPATRGCFDEYAECSTVSVFCGIVANVTESCRLTCGVCQVASTVPAGTISVTPRTTQLATTAASVKCEDTFPNCAEMLLGCKQPQTVAFLSRTCKRTCGFCSDEVELTTMKPTEAAKPCNDTVEVCQTWANAGFCDTYIYPQMEEYMKVHCKNSCKLCDVSSWSEWSQCSTSCGGGEKTRQRPCNEGNGGKVGCTEPVIERRECSSEVCPLEPNKCVDRMSTRSCVQYKEKGACNQEPIDILCNATCGFCSNDPPAGNNTSTGNEVCEDQHERCTNWTERGFCRQTYSNYMKANCPKSCGLCDVWLQWSGWSLCNATCNGGVQSRNRTCAIDKCVGETTEMTTCNTFQCNTCVDQTSSCSLLEKVGKCREVLWKYMCKNTCGLCAEPPMTGRCADTRQECSNITLSSQCSNPSVANACPVTCGKCNAPTEATPITTSTRRPQSCVDNDTNCPLVAKLGQCSDNRVSSTCPFSCGVCVKKFAGPSDTSDNEAPECIDRLSVCANLTAECGNSLVRSYCPKSCGLCQEQSNYECVDIDSTCPKLARLGQCQVSSLVAQSCKKSCNPSYCETQVPTLIPEKPIAICEDKNLNCAILTTYFSCSNQLTADSCPKTCGTCIEPTATKIPQGPTECKDNHTKCREYHAVGRCQNMFIQHICPYSCDSCEDVEYIPPACEDKFGSSCRYMESKCSSSIMKFGCEKTCKVCDECQDRNTAACESLADVGMCSRGNFQALCPRTCNVCADDTINGNDNADGRLEVCKDDISECAFYEQQGLCKNQPLIQTMCKKSCDLCPATGTAADFPCEDFSAQQCQLIKTLGQCQLHTETSMTFFCAKSCGLCQRPNVKKTVPQCRDDDPFECNQYKGLCSYQSIWTKCKQTCNKCDEIDQEGAANDGGEYDYEEGCQDNMVHCSKHKGYCGMERVGNYMDSMCPRTCAACRKVGTWSKWGSWSGCSKSCHDQPGTTNFPTRTRARTCKDGASCSGNDTKIGFCNKDACPLEDDPAGNAPVACVDKDAQCRKWKEKKRCREQRYKNQMQNVCPLTCGFCEPQLIWSNWSDCNATCGNGTQTRTLKCEVENKCRTNPNFNTTEQQNCFIKPCESWSTWSSWSNCSATCGTGTKLRIRTCSDGEAGGKMCPGLDIEEIACASDTPCSSWSTWSHWSVCNATCGQGSKTRSRKCLNASENSTCAGEATESDNCNGVSCVLWSEWLPWSTCSLPCGGLGTQKRQRTCFGGNLACGDASDAREERSCGRLQCAPSEIWSNWSECSVTCGEFGVQERFRLCPGEMVCPGNSTQVRQCGSNLPCIRWTAWTGFSECTVSCGGGVQTRKRHCKSIALDKSGECSGESTQSMLCNCRVCPDVGVWSAWGAFGECSVSCGGGNKLRRRICLNGIPGRGGCQGPSHNEQSCGKNECPFGSWNDWTSWTACSLSCGTGVRSKERVCIDGEAGVSGCPGLNEVVELCNNQSCPVWFWLDWSPCSTSCGNNGIRQRNKTCLDPLSKETLNESFCGPIVNMAEETPCNVRVCPTWGTWGNWSECTASCGVGWTGRQRVCLNGRAGDTGCDDGDAQEKESCNEWDCPSSCPAVPMQLINAPGALFSASSELEGFEAYRSIMNTDFAWCPKASDNAKWIQIDLRIAYSVAGISVQGYLNESTGQPFWVSRFQVLYENSKGKFKPLLDNTGGARTFIGPVGPIEIATRHWEPVESQSWRVKVLSVEPRRKGCLRMELLSCQGNPTFGLQYEGSSL
ncbi:uncharacterized protein LOC143445480 isoform X3 [Clavelina lepadiformis]|uniref:uncharacterized protein LOC143445480 isoform X3 n=1 Tax=Clavelina lepadiformis TaxID=159417 RepID=UPI00404209B9